MKNLRNITRTVIFLMSLGIPLMGLIGCSNSDDSSDNDLDCNNWTEQYLTQANAYSDAATLYANDPSLINCQNYKAAGLDYIDALEGVIDCVPTATTQEYINSLNEYRDEVNAIECN